MRAPPATAGGAAPRAGRAAYPSHVRSPAALAICLVVALAAAGCLDHYVIHSRRPPAGVATRSETAVAGKLLMRLEWARPAAAGGRRPAVIVHPEAGHTAREMRGMLHDLAARGYVAVAADYRRATPRGTYRSSLFNWREPGDARAVWERVVADPGVDPARIALLGFSQGGVYSLMIAAQTGEAAAVVAYYPVTDFETWLDTAAAGGREAWVFRLIRRHFRKQSGAATDAEFRALLGRASPLRHAGRITAPVLLVHGTRDRSAGVEESRRLAARLRELGREVELLEVPEAGHVFNFRVARKATAAWDATVAFLQRHLAAAAPAPTGS